MNSGENILILLLIAGGFTLLIGIVLVAAYFAFKKNSSKASYDRQLEEILADENEDEFKDNIFTRWNRHWGSVLKETGWIRYKESDNRAGREVIIAAVVIGAVLGAVTLNPIIGLAGAAAFLLALSLVLKNTATRKSEKISDQLPGFLFALKANVQANETPERALLKIIDSMPSPLYEDLVHVRSHILANSSFKEALEDLSEKTSSRDLKFLCACMIQAANSGANIEKQITVIQKVIESRKKISDELSKAARTAKPAMILATVAIPAAFFGVFFIDPQASSFWFVQPVSWLIIMAIVGFWAFGIFMVRRMVNNIKNL